MYISMSLKAKANRADALRKHACKQLLRQRTDATRAEAPANDNAGAVQRQAN